MKKNTLFISIIMLCLTFNFVSCNGGFGQKEPQVTDFTYEIPQDLIDAVCRADRPLNYTVNVKLYNSNETGNILGQGSTTFNNEAKSCEPIVIPAVPLNTPFTAYVTIVESGTVICEGISRDNELTESNKTVKVKLSVTNESDFLHVGYKNKEGIDCLIYGTVTDTSATLGETAKSIDYGSIIDYCVDGGEQWLLCEEEGDSITLKTIAKSKTQQIYPETYKVTKIARDPMESSNALCVLGEKFNGDGESEGYYTGVYNGEKACAPNSSSLNLSLNKSNYEQKITNYYVYNKQEFFATVEYKNYDKLDETNYETAQVYLYCGANDTNPLNLTEQIDGLKYKYAEVVDMQYQAGHLYVLIGNMKDNFSTAYDTGYLVECTVTGNHIEFDRYINCATKKTSYVGKTIEEGCTWVSFQPTTENFTYDSLIGKTEYDSSWDNYSVDSNILYKIPVSTKLVLKTITPSASNANELANPVKFVAVKPGKLYFADYYRCNKDENKTSIKCISRIVEVDLLSFTISNVSVIPSGGLSSSSQYNFSAKDTISAYSYGCYNGDLKYYIYEVTEADGDYTLEVPQALDIVIDEKDNSY